MLKRLMITLLSTSLIITNILATANITTKNLNIASLQNSSKSRSHSKGASIGYSGGSPSSVGINQSRAHARSKETIQTDLLANMININTKEATTIKGATIAAVDAQGDDNGKLNLKTNTLTVSSLNNTHNAKSTTTGITLGGNVKENTASNVSLDYSNDRTNSKTKTLATLGSGNIQIADKTDSQTRMLNRDITNNTVDIYNILSHKGLKGELDTRMLTKSGRAAIANDVKKSKVGFYDVAKDIITSDSLTIVDSFSHQGNKVAMYDGIQNAIKNDKNLKEQLANPNLTKDEKNNLLRNIAQSVASNLNIELADVSTIATDKQTQDAKEIQGGYHQESGDIVINDKNINSTGEAMNTLGHELAHSLDSQRGETRSEANSQEYANIMGASLQDYVEFGMYNYTDKNLATTNTHNGLSPSTSVFSPNYDQATQNFESRVDRGEVEFRQLAPEEVALNYTQDAEDLKQALADMHQNLSKTDVDAIFFTTQKAEVNFMDKYLMDLTLKTTLKDKAKDIKFVSEEAKIYFKEASKGKVYTDRNTLTNRPMMDKNNYMDSTYDPASNKKIVGDTVTSVALTAAGLVPNPMIAIPAWAIDTGRSIKSTDWNDYISIGQNMSAPIIGNPLMSNNYSKIGAGISIINITQNILNYSDKVQNLEEQRNRINNGK